MSNCFAVLSKSRLLQSISVLTVASIASIGGAHADPANVTPSNVNVLNLLSPFLGLNANPTGKTTLIDNLNQAISINNSATPAQQDLAYSDKNLLGAASNVVTGLSDPETGPSSASRRTSPADCLTSLQRRAASRGINPSAGTPRRWARFTRTGQRLRQWELFRAAKHGEPARDRLQHFHQLRPRRSEILFANGTSTEARGCSAHGIHVADVQRAAEHHQQRL